MYFSSNLTNDELANYVEIDGDMIDYLGSQLKDNVTPEAAYDLLLLLSSCKKNYIYKEKLQDIYFFILASTHYSNIIKAQCVMGLGVIDPDDQSLFDRILCSGVDINDFDIRRHLISYLELSKFAECFIDFILQSILIMDRQQSHVGDGIIRLLMSFERPSSILKIIKVCSNSQTLAVRHYQGNNINFEEKELAAILEKAEKLYPQESKMVPTVYMLFRKMEHVTHDEVLRPAFLQFFKNTCGNKILFKKIYKYDSGRDELMYFIDEDDVNFLVKEFLDNKLTLDQITVARNRLSWINIELAENMNKQLIDAGYKEFYTEPNDFDYLTLENDYQLKNQKLLFDRQLFKEEVEGIFGAAPQSDVTNKMLHNSFNKNMRNYRFSIVKDKISDYCRSGLTINKETFYAIFESESEWLDYSIGGARDYIQKEKNPPLLPEYEKNLKEYLVEKIQKASFENAITDTKNGSVSYNPHHAFLKELYILIDIELDDENLVKMLQADFSSYFSETKEKTVASKVLEQVKDKNLLRQTIVGNIKSGKLSSWVLASHFKLCQKLRYQEILPELYKAITTNAFIADHERHGLLEVYKSLGGDLIDFKNNLKLPPKSTKEDWHTWEWYLLQNFAEIKDQKAGDLLVQIAADDMRDKKEIVEAIKLLLQTGRKEGLQCWIDYVTRIKEVPFEFSEARHIEEYCRIQGNEEDLKKLFDVIDFTYENNLYSPRPYNSIQETIFSFVNKIAIKDSGLFEVAKNETTRLIDKYKDKPYNKDLYVYLERLSQKFYENHQYIIKLEAACEHYESLVVI